MNIKFALAVTATSLLALPSVAQENAATIAVTQAEFDQAAAECEVADATAPTAAENACIAGFFAGADGAAGVDALGLPVATNITNFVPAIGAGAAGLAAIALAAGGGGGGTDATTSTNGTNGTN